MKVYNLCCEHDHRFEGWFASEQDCNEQLASSRVACPLCESAAVKRVPSAPRVRKTPSLGAETPALQDVQARVVALMREMVAQSEDVGDRFAEEARRIHYEGDAGRSIRGVASREECESLVEEGIPVLPIPDAIKQPLH